MNHTLDIELHGHVRLLRFERPPHNHVDDSLMSSLADSLEAMDRDEDCRAIVLTARGKVFCAGAELGSSRDNARQLQLREFYGHAMRLYRTRKPIVAAVQGAAIGAGLGLALVADFRVASRGVRLSANFTRLGFHPGFGMSVMLPRVVGEQAAARLFYTGARITSDEGQRIGLVDELVEGDPVPAALALAREIAVSAPLAVESVRETLRLGLADRVQAANQRELAIQEVQFATQDYREGVAATAERREPVFRRR